MYNSEGQNSWASYLWDKYRPQGLLDSQYEEEELVIHCCKMGYGKTRGEVLKIVEETMLRSLMAQYLMDDGVVFGKGGLNLVSERVMCFLLHVKNVDPEIFCDYFNLLEETLLKCDLKKSTSIESLAILEDGRRKRRRKEEKGEKEKKKKEEGKKKIC